MHTKTDYKALRKSDKERMVRRYFERFGRGLFVAVSEQTGKHPSQVSRTYWGHTKRPDQAVVDALSEELGKLAIAA